MEQVGESRILWRRQEFATLLNVVEDSRDPEHLTTSFELVQSVRRRLRLCPRKAIATSLYALANTSCVLRGPPFPRRHPLPET